MDTSEYNKIKQDILNLPVVYKELEAQEIVAMGDNFYSFGNTIVKVAPTISAKIDYVAGLKGNQAYIAHANYGDQGVTNLRNFFGQAAKGHRIAIAANIESKEVTDVIPLNNKLITPYAFFNFMDMYMDKNQYYPEKVGYTDGGNKISILMKPVHEEFCEFSKGDEFLSNAITFKWSPTEISMGNYFVRLICTNGATQAVHDPIAQISSPDIEDFRQLLSITSKSDIFNKNLPKMLESAKTAIRTKASVRELSQAVSLLKHEGVEDEVANQIIPYKETRSQYLDAGYTMDIEHMAFAKSDKTMWEVYNMLTFFATHNKVWAPNDIKRANLMESSTNLLLRKRDIIEYNNIF